jgi:HK97 gp10 family phage protein
VFMADEVRVEGLEEVFEMLDRVVSQQALGEGLQKACALVERTAKQLAPKDTGALRRSISSKVEGNQGIVFTPLEYAPYVEFGTGLFAEVAGRKDTPWSYQDDKGEWHSTSGQKPHPFMRPALAQNRAQIKKLLGGSITNND